MSPLSTSSVLKAPGAIAQPAGEVAATGCDPRGPVVASSDLLQGRKAVEISHNGLLYRLQATKLGKLILTK